MPLSDTGYVVTPLSERIAELEQNFRQVFGAGIRTDPASNFGKLIAIMADREVGIDQNGQAQWNSKYTTTATGISLDRIVRLYYGIARKGATSSTATVYVRGASGGKILIGDLFAVVGSEERFQATQNVTIGGVGELNITSMSQAAGTATATTAANHSMSVGQYVFVRNAVITGYNGIHLITGVPAANQLQFSVSSSLVAETGSPIAHQGFAVPVEAVNTGAIQALAGTISKVITSNVSITEAANKDDAIPGTNIETDPELIARAIASPQGTGKATNPAITRVLNNIENVTSAVVAENDTDVVDVEGRPPHSIEAVVQGGTDQDIADTIYATKGAGITTHGTTTVSVTDSEGNPKDILFSRPVNIDIWLEMDVTTNALFPADGATQVVNSVLAYGLTLVAGDDVIVHPELEASLDGIGGITDIVYRIEGVPDGDPDPLPALDQNITITATQLAVFDSTRITVTII